MDRVLPPPSIAWVAVAASLGFAVVSLDVTIVNIALPRLAEALGSTVPGLQWVVDAYTLAFAVLLLSAGVLSDRLGARRTYLLGFILFALASMACGAAQSAGQLIAARAVQGIGAALLVPPSLALLNHACAHEPALRARMIGLWHMAGGVAIAAGPVLGGLLLDRFGWRGIFLVNLPLCALGIGMTLRLHETPRKPQRQLDLLGQSLAAAALFGLIGALIELGALGWMQPLVLGGFALAVAATLGFVRVESHVAQPMLPLRFFALRGFTPAVLIGMAISLAYYGAIFMLSLYLQHVRHYAVAQAGLAYLPLTATWIVSNLLSGWTIGRYGARWPALIGTALSAGGFVLLARLDAHSAYTDMLLPFLLIPGGMGLTTPALTTIVLASVETAWSGTATAVLNAARQAGGAIGVALCGALVAGGDTRIVPGMRLAAWLCASLLLAACAVAARHVGRKMAASGRNASRSGDAPVPATSAIDSASTASPSPDRAGSPGTP